MAQTTSAKGPSLLSYRTRQVLLGSAPLLFFLVLLLTLRLLAVRASLEAAVAAMLALLGCLGSAGLAIVESLPPRRFAARAHPASPAA